MPLRVLIDDFQKEYAELEKEVVTANEKTAESLEAVEKGAKDGAKGVKKVGVSLGKALLLHLVLYSYYRKHLSL